MTSTLKITLFMQFVWIDCAVTNSSEIPKARSKKPNNIISEREIIQRAMALTLLAGYYLKDPQAFENDNAQASSGGGYTLHLRCSTRNQ